MSAVAAPAQTDLPEPEVVREVDRFLDRIADLPCDDITRKLKRLGYVSDRVKLEFAKAAARLATQFANEDVGDMLDAPTAGECIRHNCKKTRSAAYDAINVGEQLHQLTKCADAVATGEIGFAHLSVIARTSSALEKADRGGPFFGGTARARG